MLRFGAHRSPNPETEPHYYPAQSTVLYVCSEEDDHSEGDRETQEPRLVHQISSARHYPAKLGTSSMRPIERDFVEEARFIQKNSAFSDESPKGPADRFSRIVKTQSSTPTSDYALEAQHQYSLRYQLAQLRKKAQAYHEYSLMLESTLMKERKQWKQTYLQMQWTINEKEQHIHGLMEFSNSLQAKLEDKLNSPKRGELKNSKVVDTFSGAFNYLRAQAICQHSINDASQLQQLRRRVHTLQAEMESGRLSNRVQIGVQTDNPHSEVCSAKVISEDTITRSECNTNLVSESLLEMGIEEQALKDENEWLQNLNKEKEKVIENLSHQLNRSEECRVELQRQLRRKGLNRNLHCSMAQPISASAKDLEESVRQLKNENEHLRLFRAGLLQVEHERNTLKKQLESLSESMDSSRKDTPVPQRLVEEIKTLQNQVIKLQNVNSAMNRDIKELTAAGNYLNQQKQVLEGCLDEIWQELERSRKEVTELERECDNKQQQINQLEEWLMDAKKNLEYLLNRVKEEQQCRDDLVSLSNRSVEGNDCYQQQSNLSFELNFSEDVISSHHEATLKETHPTEHSETPMRKSVKMAKGIYPATNGSQQLSKRDISQSCYSLSDDLREQIPFERQLNNLIKQYGVFRNNQELRSSISHFMHWSGQFASPLDFLREAESFLRNVANFECSVAERLRNLEIMLASYFNDALTLIREDQEAA